MIHKGWGRCLECVRSVKEESTLRIDFCTWDVNRNGGGGAKFMV